MPSSAISFGGTSCSMSRSWLAAIGRRVRSENCAPLGPCQVPIATRGEDAGATCNAWNRLNKGMGGVIVRFLPKIDDRVLVRCLSSDRDPHVSKRHLS